MCGREANRSASGAAAFRREKRNGLAVPLRGRREQTQENLFTYKGIAGANGKACSSSMAKFLPANNKPSNILPMKKTLLALLATAALGLSASQASLIVYEGFNYTVGTNNPDPDGGLNGGNGLPATNVGGNPSGTSTGLFGAWGTTLNVANGLTYSQGNNTLTTTGGAGAPNNATWGTDLGFYRFMTLDPFASVRVGGASNDGFAANGTTLWFSVLAKTTSSTAAAFRFKLSGNSNVFFENTTDKWTINPSSSPVASTGNMTVGETALLVFSIGFTAGNETFNLWVNPTLGGSLGAANATHTTSSDWGDLYTNAFNLRPSTLGAMTIDEFRMGQSFADVTPFTVIPEPATWALLVGSLTALVVFRRRRA